MAADLALSGLTEKLFQELLDQVRSTPAWPDWADDFLGALARGKLVLPDAYVVPDPYALDTWPLFTWIRGAAAHQSSDRDRNGPDSDTAAQQDEFLEQGLRALIHQTLETRARMHHELHGEPEAGQKTSWQEDLEREMTFALVACEPVWLRGYQIWQELGGPALLSSEANIALIEALKGYNTENVRLALVFGADPNLEDDDRPALALAKCAEMVRTLLDHGADPRLPSLSGAYAEDIWVQQGRRGLGDIQASEVLGWLRAVGPHPEPLAKLPQLLADLSEEEWEQRWKDAGQSLPQVTDLWQGRTWGEWMLLSHWYVAGSHKDRFGLMYDLAGGDAEALVLHQRWHAEWVERLPTVMPADQVPWRDVWLAQYTNTNLQEDQWPVVRWHALFDWWKGLPEWTRRADMMAYGLGLTYLTQSMGHGDTRWLDLLETMATTPLPAKAARNFWPTALRDLLLDRPGGRSSVGHEERLGRIILGAIQSLASTASSSQMAGMIETKDVMDLFLGHMSKSSEAWIRAVAHVPKGDQIWAQTTMRLRAIGMEERAEDMSNRALAYTREQALLNLPPSSTPKARRFRG